MRDVAIAVGGIITGVLVALGFGSMGEEDKGSPSSPAVYAECPSGWIGTVNLDDNPPVGEEPITNTCERVDRAYVVYLTAGGVFQRAWDVEGNSFIEDEGSVPQWP